MNNIHPTAKVHPTAILEGEIHVGARSVIGPHCVLTGPVHIGEGVILHAFCVLGSPPEHMSAEAHGAVHVGDRSVLHPFCLVSRGTGARETRIGADCYLMDHVHLSHDSSLGDHVVVAQNVVLAGHVRVHTGANLGAGAVFHQRGTVGAYAMVGMGSVVTRDIPPFVVVSGCPARFMRLHARGAEKAGIDFAALRVEDDALVGEQAAVRTLLDNFHADVRDGRRVLSLTARSSRK
jgi:UDP-N-acetylglucosamine acyltransferase